MTRDTLGVIYIALSVALFLYAIRDDRSALFAYAVAIALNIFPVVSLGYLGMTEMRFMRVPIAYFPITAAVLATFWRGGIGPGHPRLRRLFILCAVFLVYLPIQTFVLSDARDWRSFVPYYTMWVVNIGVVFPLTRIAARMGREEMLRACRVMIGVVWAGTVAGLVRHAAGLYVGANFMPLMNPNGTVIVVVMTWPLLLMCRDMRRIPKWLFYAALVSLPLCSLLITSRMGFFGTWAALGAYYWFRKRRVGLAHVVRYVGALALLGVVGWAILASPAGRPLRVRVLQSWASIGMLSDLEYLDHSVADYRRANLFYMSTEVVRENLLWGTGVGLENYVDELDRLFLFNTDRAKPHCFYLSGLAELGIFGFAMCLLILYGIWRGLAPARPEREQGSDATLVSACFRSVFVAVIVMFVINEYVGYSVIWAFFGMGLGMCIDARRSLDDEQYPSSEDGVRALS